MIREQNNRKFLGCSNYPYCNYTLKEVEVLETNIKCKQCGGYLVKRKGKYGTFLGCVNYPACDYTEKVEKE